MAVEYQLCLTPNALDRKLDLLLRTIFLCMLNILTRYGNYQFQNNIAISTTHAQTKIIILGLGPQHTTNIVGLAYNVGRHFGDRQCRPTMLTPLKPGATLSMDNVADKITSK